jgi:TonB family protein
MNDKKILIVDFDAESLIALSNLVYEEGFQAETATDGLAAYEKFRSGRFDLVILEPMLPKLHGFELCKRIVNDPERKVPVIIVTAIYREPQCKHDALTVNGAAAFFTKPYNRDELRSKMLQLLVEGRDTAEKRVEAPAASPVPPKAPAAAQSASSPVNIKSHRLELKDLLGPKPVPRETKTAARAIDIEKELQEAVSGLVRPAKKNEAVVRRDPDVRQIKEEFRQLREKRETKVHGDRDIDTLLKEAIGGLADSPRKVSDAPRRETVVKPAPPAKPENRAAREEKIPVAEEIKQRLPFQPGKPNNIPRPAARVELGRGAVPFDIDKTLIEIDQIPLEDAKSARAEALNAAPAFPEVQKKAIFEEFAEPDKKKPKAAIIGAAAAVLVLAASAAFLVLKPKKPGPPPQDNVATVEDSAAGGNISRPENAKSYPDTAEAELKPEPKRAAVKPAPEQPVEIGAPIQPTVTPQGTLLQLQEQPAVNTATSPAAQSATVIQAESAAQPPAAQQKAQEAPAVSSAPPGGEWTVEKAREGALVALDQADAAPVLTKRVEPKYPPIALRSGAAGTITVNALISEKGDVLRTEILKGVKNGFGLEDAAEAAIRQWKFKPAQKDGASVKVWKSFDITFKPNIKTS